MKYVPEWTPFAGFKKQAREWRVLSQMMVNDPYDMAKGQFVSVYPSSDTSLSLTSQSTQSHGALDQCFVSECLEEISVNSTDALSEELIKNTAAVAYAAGADTVMLILLYGASFN